MIVGLTGTIGAGKGTVTEVLIRKGFAHYSSSGLLGELVAAEGNPKGRESLAQMATSLQSEYPGGVLEKNYRERYLDTEQGDAVFEAIHRVSEATFLKSIGGIIIAVDADLEIRYERTHARNEGEKDQVTFEEFKAHAAIEDDGGGDEKRDNNIRAVFEMADVVLQNNGTIEELEEKVNEALKTISDETNR